MHPTVTAHRVRSTILPVALLLSACGGPGGAVTGGGQEEPSPSELTLSPKSSAPAIVIQLARSRTSPVAFTSEFLLASDGAIEIASDLSGLSRGVHTLSQQLLAPDGSRFASCAFSFDPSGSGAPSGDCAAAAGAKLGTGQSAAYRLWNTVVPAKKWGTWTVQAFLDGAAAPSATAQLSFAGPWAELRFAASRVSPAWASAFPIASTSQLEIATDLQGFAAGAHATRMDLIDSNGMLFTTVHDSFDPADPATCDEVVDGACRIWWTLQIAGTTVEQFQMTGTWKVKQTIDSAESALVAASFQLQ